VIDAAEWEYLQCRVYHNDIPLAAAYDLYDDNGSLEDFCDTLAHILQRGFEYDSYTSFHSFIHSFIHHSIIDHYFVDS
jgi:hypothetical protein